MAEDNQRGRASTYRFEILTRRSKMRRMRLVTYSVFIVAGVFFLSNGVLYAQENQTAVTQEKEEIKNEPQPAQEEKISQEAPRFQEKPAIKGYTYNLKRLLEQAQENVKKIDEEIKQAEIRKRNEERETKVIEHFEKGNQLYQEGKLKEAKIEWQKALEVSQDPEIRDYIKESEKRAREEELTRKKEEEERQRRLEVEQKEKERQLNEQAKVFYEEALSLYNSKNYEQAQVKFEQAAQVVPNYAKTDYYFKRIPEDIQKEKERLELERQRALQEQRKAEEKRKQEELKKQQEEQQREALEKQKQLAEQKAKREQELKVRQEDLAKKREEELIRKKQEHEQRQEQAYLEKERKKQELLKKQEELFRQKAEKERQRQEEFSRKEAERRAREAKLSEEKIFRKKVANSFSNAKSLYGTGKYKEAIAAFNEVLQLDPNHPKAKDYIQHCQNKMEKIRLEQERKQKKEDERLEKERRKKLEAEAKEKERLETK